MGIFDMRIMQQFLSVFNLVVELVVIFIVPFETILYLNILYSMPNNLFLSWKHLGEDTNLEVLLDANDIVDKTAFNLYRNINNHFNSYNA